MEYKVDSQRIYLMGHSMGGFGTYYLGQKYASKWAAIDRRKAGLFPRAEEDGGRTAPLPLLGDLAEPG